MSTVADSLNETRSAFSDGRPEPIARCPLQRGAAPAPVKTWVKIRLVDMKGGPVPGERYRIHLPGGGAPIEGTLDAAGEASCYDVDPGACRITFPDLDEQAWDEEEAKD